MTKTPSSTNSAIDRVDAILSPGRKLRPVAQHIWSALEVDPGPQHYDSIASLYDRVIGNRLYQRIAWGNEIARDTALAQAAASSADGWMLDAGCGSLLFTAGVHARSGRPTVALDVSIEMLQRGRERLIAACGEFPDHVVLLQGDALALPFARASFQTILCPGIVHLVAQPRQLFESLVGVLATGGGLSVSALVTDRPFGARMLRWMQRRGEVPNPLEAREFSELIAEVTARKVHVDTRGNMAHFSLDSGLALDGASGS